MVVPEEVDIISFWKPNMTINVVDDYTRFDSERHVPPQLRGGMPGRRSFVCVLRRRWCTREQKKRSGCGERERVHVPSMPCLYPHALLQTNRRVLDVLLSWRRLKSRGPLLESGVWLPQRCCTTSSATGTTRPCT